MPTILYCRRSSESGDNYSLDSQDAACQRYAESNGLLPAESIVQNVTGTKHLRDRHPALWADIESQRVGALVVYTLDRLSRADLIDALSLLRDIMQMGCQIHACDVGRIVDVNDIGLIVRSWQSSDERRKIVDRMSRGRIGKAKVTWVGAGRVPYGYQRAGAGREAHLEIDESEAAIVRLIFDSYIGGYPLLRLSDMLNSRGVASPGGVRWRVSGVRAVLVRSIYCGRVKYGSVEIMDSKLQIVTLDKWNAAQARIKYNTENSLRNTQHDYLMRGHVYCHCGRRMSPMINKPYASRYRCYATGYPKGAGRCSGSLDVAQLDALVIDYIRSSITDDAIRRGIEYNARQDAVQAQPDRLAEIDADLAKQRTRIDRLISAFADGDDDAQRHISAARETVAALEQERAGIVNAEETARARQAARESIASHVVRLRGALDNPAFEMWRELVEVLDVKASLVTNSAGRAVRLNCAVAEDATVPL